MMATPTPAPVCGLSSQVPNSCWARPSVVFRWLGFVAVSDDRGRED